MSVILFDRGDKDRTYYLNLWHWHTIVEAVRRLKIIPEPRAIDLHVSFIGAGLTGEEAGEVAAALRASIIPTLAHEERLLLDGSKTAAPADGVLDHVDPLKCYSTDAAALEGFAEFCDSCDGFNVC